MRAQWECSREQRISLYKRSSVKHRNNPACTKKKSVKNHQNVEDGHCMEETLMTLFFLLFFFWLAGEGWPDVFPVVREPADWADHHGDLWHHLPRPGASLRRPDNLQGHLGRHWVNRAEMRPGHERELRPSPGEVAGSFFFFLSLLPHWCWRACIHAYLQMFFALHLCWCLRAWPSYVLAWSAYVPVWLVIMPAQT